jgi:hypothetical protein
LHGFTSVQRAAATVSGFFACERPRSTGRVSSGQAPSATVPIGLREPEILRQRLPREAQRSGVGWLAPAVVDEPAPDCRPGRLNGPSLERERSARLLVEAFDRLRLLERVELVESTLGLSVPNPRACKRVHPGSAGPGQAMPAGRHDLAAAAASRWRGGPTGMLRTCIDAPPRDRHWHPSSPGASAPAARSTGPSRS